MYRLLVGACALGFAVSCTQDLTLPDPPAPAGPGTIQGTLVYAVAGQAAPVPATGATVQLLASSLATRAMTDDAFFQLRGITSDEGTLLIQFDIDNDGQPDRQKRLTLRDIGAGLGKNVTLGPVTLGRNAVVAGKVLRSDVAGSARLLAGTSVFVPEGPFSTVTGDDGSFVFDSLPEGQITLAFFAGGYATEVVTTSLRGGERLTLQEVTLQRTVGPTPLGTLTGRVAVEGQPGIDVEAVLSPIGSGPSTTATTDATGRFVFSALTPGLFVLTLSRPGLRTAVIPNVLVASGDNTVVASLVPAAVGDTGGGAGGGGGVGGGTGGGGGGGGSNVDAGRGDDAGTTFDAGVDDAGMFVIDAGAKLEDAGVVVDAGFDAGLPEVDAGVPTLDAGIDAGVADAGPPLAAIIAQTDGGFGFGAPGGSYTLDGRDSVGVFPISYAWTQLSGPPVAITPSSGLGAGAPVITLPQTLAVLQFRLTITDGEGRQASAVSQVRVADAPTAVISPPSTLALTSGQPITLDGSASSDPNALALSFSWQQLSGRSEAVITPLPGGRCIVTAPIVTTPTSFTIGLKLSNVFGVSASATPVTFTVTPAAVPDAGNWTIDVPSPIAAVGGGLVTLGVTPNTTVVGATFTYEWTPSTDPTPANEWVLSSGSVQTPTFIAPNAVGLPRSLTFQVRVTAQNTALRPSELFGTVVVNIADETAPTLTGSTLNGAGQGSGVGISFTFSEPIDPASTGSVSLSDFNGVHPITATVSGNQLTITPLTLLVEGGHYTVTLLGLRDRSPRQNVMTTLTRDWYPTFNFSVPWQSSTSSTNEPRPGIVVHRGGTSPTEVQLVGTKQDGGVFAPWLLNPVLAFNQTCNPCIVNDGPVVAAPIQNALREGDRVFTHLGLSQVQLEQAGVGPATTSLVLAANAQRAVSVLSPATDGVLYSDGATLRSAGPASGSTLGLRTLTAGVWSSPELIDNVSTWSSNAEVVGLARQLGPNLLNFVSGIDSNGALQIFYRDSTWHSAETSIAGASQLRLLPYISGNPSAQTFYISTNTVNAIPTQQLTIYAYGPNASAYFGVFSAVDGLVSYDALINEGITYVAASVNGNIVVFRMLSGYPNSWLPIPGPNSISLSTPALDDDPTCEATRPDLALVDGALFVAWQERCLSGPWKMFMRALR